MTLTRDSCKTCSVRSSHDGSWKVAGIFQRGYRWRLAYVSLPAPCAASVSPNLDEGRQRQLRQKLRRVRPPELCSIAFRPLETLTRPTPENCSIQDPLFIDAIVFLLYSRLLICRNNAEADQYTGSTLELERRRIIPRSCTSRPI
jgi:hypothetical protein